MDNDSQPILYWNRQRGRLEEEHVYGERWVKALYGTGPGQKLADGFLSGRLLSELYGELQSSRLSRRKVAPFIATYQIPMEEFEAGPFRTFNDFFIRRFRPGARDFTPNAERMGAFAEARYLAFESVTDELRFPVKGEHLTAAGLLGHFAKSARFLGGPMLIARLCPTDYHRFHFPDDGRAAETYRVHGRLHSVNPMALLHNGAIFATNERQVTILETRNFGALAYIEVGAMCVGKIVQTHAGGEFRKGDEKGYFLFGASTVIVLGEKGAWAPDADLLEQTRQKRETLVRLGDGVARRIG